MTLPLVSVCIPTYNDGTFLRICLESVAKQTYPNLEILVGDDQSTDDTEEIVRAFSDSRMRYQRNERNLGQFDNVNSIIERAAGKYVAIYHSDDHYDLSTVEKEVAFLEAHPGVGAVFALDRRIDQEGKVIGVTPLPEGISPNTALGMLDVLPVLMRHKNRLFRAPTFMGRREIFDAVGLFKSNYDIAGDLEMWLRILRRYRVAILDEHLLYYRRGRAQISSRYHYLRTGEEHFFVAMDEYLAEDNRLARIDRRSRIEYAFHRSDDETLRAANHLIRGETEQARRMLDRRFPWKALQYRPRRRKLRVLLLRALLGIGLALRATGPLSRVLIRTEYGGHVAR